MLVVGLGNPGPRYAGSPHNAGFRVLDHFAEHQTTDGRAVWTERFEAKFAMAAVDAQQLILLKPLTYMNRSGESVRKAMSFFDIDGQAALVVHDELDLPLGTVKLKHGGGEAGHNGLKSVSAELGTRDYSRLRVGVGRPATGEVRDFLLSPLAAAEDVRLEESLGDAVSAIGLWARHGIEQAMNQVNRRAAAPKPRSEGQPE